MGVGKVSFVLQEEEEEDFKEDGLFGVLLDMTWGVSFCTISSPALDVWCRIKSFIT